ncbi:MAG: hypothetical protein JXB60_07130 [Candidatus Cloacimonetes bacterium]|nr:hypothetical protein [Candidatus Cloacimonadota bacterium]
MKTWSTVWFIVILSLSLKSVCAYDLKEGITSLNNGNYTEAYQIFDNLLNQQEIAGQQKAKALFYRGKARLEMVYQAAVTEDHDIINSYPDFLISSYRDFIRASVTTDQTLLNKINSELTALYYPMLNYAWNIIDYLLSAEKVPPSEKTLLLTELDNYIYAALNIRPEHYFVHFINARRCLAADAYDQANAAITKTFQLYEKVSAAEPDLNVPTLYYDLALYHFQQKRDLTASLNALHRGMQFLNKEFKKLKANKDRFDPADWQNLENQYQDNRKALIGLEASFYKDTPARLKDGIKYFATLLTDSPSDFNYLMAYAFLQEDINPDSSISCYQKAMTINPLDKTVYFNLGMLHYNLARIAADSLQTKQPVSPTASQLEHYQQAMQKLEHYHEMEPLDMDVISTLFKIYNYLEYKDKAEDMRKLMIFWE